MTSVFSSILSSGWLNKRRAGALPSSSSYMSLWHSRSEPALCSACRAFIFQIPRLVFKLEPFGNAGSPQTAARSPPVKRHAGPGLWCTQTTRCSVIVSVALLPPLPGWMVQPDNYNSCCSPDWLTSDFWPPVGHFNWLMYNERSSLKQGYFEAREEKALMLEGSDLICRFNW